MVSLRTNKYSSVLRDIQQLEATFRQQLQEAPDESSRSDLVATADDQHPANIRSRFSLGCLFLGVMHDVQKKRMTEFNPGNFESFKMPEGSECHVPPTVAVAANQRAFREAVFQSKLKPVDDVGSLSCLATMKCTVEMTKNAADVDTVHNLVVEHGASKASAMELKKSIKKVVDDLKSHVKRRASDIKK